MGSAGNWECLLFSEKHSFQKLFTGFHIQNKPFSWPVFSMCVLSAAGVVTTLIYRLAFLNGKLVTQEGTGSH